MYQKQLQNGNHFIHEDTYGTLGTISHGPGIQVDGPNCRVYDRGDDYVRLDSKWVTSSSALAAALEEFAKFPSARRRKTRLSGDLETLEIPTMLMKEVVKALRGDLGTEYLFSAEAGPIPTEDDRVFMKKQQEHFEEYWDDVNGGWLDTRQVELARKEELDWILKQNVFEKVRRDEAQGKVLSLRWIDTVKSNGGYRSRLVVREIKKAKRADEQMDPAEVFSSMPPIEGLKCLIGHMMTEQKNPDGEDLCMAVWDVSRAHLYGIAERTLYTNLPEELDEVGYVAKLLKTMYGTQDASHIWGETWVPLLQDNGIQVGTSNRTLFGNSHLKGLCHGEDFLVVASYKSSQEFANCWSPSLMFVCPISLDLVVALARS